MLGLFSGELIFGGACYRKEFCVSKWVWFVNKNSNNNIPWAYIQEGLLSEGYLHQRFGGLIFGRAYFFGGAGAYYRNVTVCDHCSCNCEVARKKGFLGLRRHLNPWPLQQRSRCSALPAEL